MKKLSHIIAISCLLLTIAGLIVWLISGKGLLEIFNPAVNSFLLKCGLIAWWICIAVTIYAIIVSWINFLKR